MCPALLPVRWVNTSPWEAGNPPYISIQAGLPGISKSQKHLKTDFHIGRGQHLRRMDYTWTRCWAWQLLRPSKKPQKRSRICRLGFQRRRPATVLLGALWRCRPEAVICPRCFLVGIYSRKCSAFRRNYVYLLFSASYHLQFHSWHSKGTSRFCGLPTESLVTESCYTDYLDNRCPTVVCSFKSELFFVELLSVGPG